MPWRATDPADPRSRSRSKMYIPTAASMTTDELASVAGDATGGGLVSRPRRSRSSSSLGMSSRPRNPTARRSRTRTSEASPSWRPSSARIAAPRAMPSASWGQACTAIRAPVGTVTGPTTDALPRIVLRLPGTWWPDPPRRSGEGAAFDPEIWCAGRSAGRRSGDPARRVVAPPACRARGFDRGDEAELSVALEIDAADPDPRGDLGDAPAADRHPGDRHLL